MPTKNRFIPFFRCCAPAPPFCFGFCLSNDPAYRCENSGAARVPDDLILTTAHGPGSFSAPCTVQSCYESFCGGSRRRNGRTSSLPMPRNTSKTSRSGKSNRASTMRMIRNSSVIIGPFSPPACKYFLPGAGKMSTHFSQRHKAFLRLTFLRGYDKMSTESVERRFHEVDLW